MFQDYIINIKNACKNTLAFYERIVQTMRVSHGQWVWLDIPALPTRSIRTYKYAKASELSACFHFFQ